MALDRLALLGVVLFCALGASSCERGALENAELASVAPDADPRSPTSKEEGSLTPEERERRIQERAERIKRLQAQNRREKMQRVEDPAERQPLSDADNMGPGVVVPTAESKLVEILGRDLLPTTFPLGEDGQPLTEVDGRAVRLVREQQPNGERRRWSYVLAEPDDPQDDGAFSSSEPDRHGPDWNFDSEGRVSIKRTWVDGQMLGPYEEFHDNGFLRSVGTQGPEGPEGVWCRLTDLGRLKSVERYRKGIKAGPFVEYHPNGLKSREGRYRGGRQFGLIKSWHLNGFLESEAEYRRGVTWGNVREWYATGQLKSEGKLQGQRVFGPWREWHRNGEPRLEEEYENDVLNGPAKQYDGRGRLRRSEEFQGGRLHGEVELYDEQAQLQSKGRYEGGQPVGEHVGYHPDGSPAWLLNYVDGTPSGPAATYWPGGDLRAEGPMQDGKRHGEWRFLDRSGQLDREWSGRWEDGRRVGP